MQTDCENHKRKQRLCLDPSPSPCLASALPLPPYLTSILSVPPSSLCLPFPSICLHLFLLMKTLTKQKWGGKRAIQPVTPTYLSPPLATRLLSSLHPAGLWAQCLPPGNWCSKPCQAHVPGDTRSPEATRGKGPVNRRALCPPLLLFNMGTLLSGVARTEWDINKQKNALKNMAAGRQDRVIKVMILTISLCGGARKSWGHRGPETAVTKLR